MAKLLFLTLVSLCRFIKASCILSAVIEVLALRRLASWIILVQRQSLIYFPFDWKMKSMIWSKRLDLLSLFVDLPTFGSFLCLSPESHVFIFTSIYQGFVKQVFFLFLKDLSGIAAQSLHVEDKKTST